VDGFGGRARKKPIGNVGERRLAEHERFLEIAGGDPELAKVVYENLRKLEDGAGGPVMQELARDVLAGRMSLREAANSGKYAEAFRDSANAPPWPDPAEGGPGTPAPDSDLERP
jgi:hypothetical protein